MEKLMYLVNARCRTVQTANGYIVVEGIEQYEGASCREKVIVRVDIFSGLTNIFRQETLRNYRTVLFRLFAGYYGNDKEKISSLVQAIYDKDTVFQDWIGEAYYFSDLLQEMSVWEYLQSSVREAFEELLSQQVQVCNAKLITVSSGYAYFSIDDYGSTPVYVKKPLSGEVVSYAKAWAGGFQEVG